MSLSRENPLNAQILGRLRGPALDEQVKKLYRRIRSANDARQPQIEKQEKLLRQRRGIRKQKSFPWPGANNHNWPLTDAIARRWKPGICSLVLQADPVCYFFARNPNALAAQPTAQDYYHWRFHSMTDVEATVLELAENIFQDGIAYTRQGWEYRTEKQCRICRVKDLFPAGVEAAVNAFNARAVQMRAETEQAIASGQAPPNALEQVPDQVDAPTLILQTLEDEYILKSDNPMEVQQLQDAVRAIMDGAEVVKFYYQVVVADKPSWRALNVRQVIIPPRTKDIANADFIAIEHPLTADEVLSMAVDGHLDMAAASKAVDRMNKNATGDPQRSIGTGTVASSTGRSLNDVLDKADGIAPGLIDEPTQDTFLEVFCKLDINGDGINERCVLWYMPAVSENDATGIVLALYPYPYPFSVWPVVRYEFEHTSNRPYSSRGAAELLSVFQATANKLHNARLDAIQITLAPMFQMRATAGELNRNIKFIPGAIIPVTNVGDIAQIPMDTSGLLQFIQEENITKNLAEQYVGVFDPGIMAENSVERRTATEVEAVLQQTQSIFGQDASLFQTSMGKVHKQLWRLEIEFGPEELYYRVTGEERPKFAKKSEIAFDFDLEPSGTPANTSQALARRKALEMIQLFMGDMTGLIDKHALFTNYFSVTDRNLGKLMVRAPEEAALFQQMMQLTTQMNGGRPVAAMP